MTRSQHNLAVVEDERMPSLETGAHQLAAQPVGGVQFSNEQLDLLREQYFKNCTDQEINLALAVCKATGLDPFLKQIVFIKRWDANAPKAGGGTGKYVMTAQPTIDGTRLMAQRSGRYAGQEGPLWCGEDGVWREIWTDKNPPVAAKVTVYSTTSRVGISAVCMFKSYAVKNKEGKLTPFWVNMPEVMIGKCAESLALRKAFPAEYSLFGAPPLTNRETAEQIETEQRIVEHDGLSWDADTGVIVQHDEATDVPGAGLARLHAAAHAKQLGTVELHDHAYASFKVTSLRDLTPQQMAALADKLEKVERNSLLKEARAIRSMRAKSDNAQDAPGQAEGDTIDAEYVDVTSDATAEATGADSDDSDEQDIGEQIIGDYVALYASVTTMDEFKAVGQKLIDNGIYDSRIATVQANKLRELKQGSA
jgi:phage recombination protein Bet